MKIQFTQDVEWEVVEQYDEETQTADSTFELFTEGSVLEVDLIDDYGDNVDIQFGDGSMAYNFPKSYFNKI